MRGFTIKLLARRYFFDGRSTKTDLYLDFNEALTFADEDIKENWEDYRDRFLPGE